MTWTKISERSPPPHRKYAVKRNGFIHTCTPCYGMHAPWWVQANMNWPDHPAEAEPVVMSGDDEWVEITEFMK